MTDEDLHARIKRLIEEEHELAGDGESADERSAHRRRIEEQLDQAWDLLRRRQAAREAGQAPEEVRARSVGEVEGYLQ